MAKFTIIEEGHTVLADGKSYGLNETFDAPKDFGEGRTWLKPEAPAKKVTEKVEDEDKPKGKSKIKVETKEDGK